MSARSCAARRAARAQARHTGRGGQGRCGVPAGRRLLAAGARQTDAGCRAAPVRPDACAARAARPTARRSSTVRRLSAAGGRRPTLPARRPRSQFVSRRPRAARVPARAGGARVTHRQAAWGTRRRRMYDLAILFLATTQKLLLAPEHALAQVPHASRAAANRPRSHPAPRLAPPRTPLKVRRAPCPGRPRRDAARRLPSSRREASCCLLFFWWPRRPVRCVRRRRRWRARRVQPAARGRGRLGDPSACARRSTVAHIRGRRHDGDGRLTRVAR
jgi:hypothetical protein